MFVQQVRKRGTELACTERPLQETPSCEVFCWKWMTTCWEDVDSHTISAWKERKCQFREVAPLEAGRSIILRWSSCHARGHDKIYQRKTEGRPTPKRAMSRQERTSHRREHSALRAVAGSLSLIARQCRPDSTKCRPYRLCVSALPLIWTGDGSTQGGFLVVFTTPELHSIGNFCSQFFCLGT